MPTSRRGMSLLLFARRIASGILSLSAFALVPWADNVSIAATQGRRIFISVDMEGVDGAVTSNQLSMSGNDYQQTRQLMTDELLAAIAGARAAGATDFVVADAHGQGQNILIDRLPNDVHLIRGTARPLGMMEGIEEGHFDGVFFLGYHAGASSLRGVRAHTFSSARLSEVRLNGIPVSEGQVNAAIAAHFGVPVLLASGDDATIEELRSAVPQAEMVEVKRSISFHAADNLAPAEAQRRIRDGATRAMRQIGATTPNRTVTATSIELTFHFYQPAELLAWLPNVQRTGARSIRYQSPDIVSAVRFLNFVLGYNVDLEP